MIEWIFVLLLLALVYMFFKNEFTLRNQMLIGRAISEYQLHMFEQGAYRDIEVDVDDMEHYNTTLFRLWDWGYKRILPPEKFEIIKPYIEK